MTDSADTTETRAPTYEASLWLTDDGLHYLAEKVGALAKRARRLDVAEPTIIAHRSVTLAPKRLGGKVWIPVEVIPGAPAEVFVRHFVTVVGEGPKLADWSLVATLQHSEAGNIVRAVPGAGEIPAIYRERGPDWCDHCRKKRRRNDTYVVRHSDGRTAQVGRTCLRDFLGHVDPKRIASLAKYITDLAAEIAESEGYGFGGGFAPRGFYPAAFLAATSAIVRDFGWTSRGKARELILCATADRTSEFVSGPPGNPDDARRWRREYGNVEVNDRDRARGAAALAWGLALGADGETLGDYLHNVKVTASMGVWRFRELGIGASILTSWDRAMGRELLRKREAKAKAASKHFGAIGERMEFTATCIFHTTWEGDYGVTHLYKFETDAGGLAVWFASRDFDIERGGTYKLRATVKKHDDYKGTAQTNVNRGKVLEVIDTPEAVANG